MHSGMVNSSSRGLPAEVAENLSSNASPRNAAHVTFSTHPKMTEAGVMVRKPFASSHFETYSSAISTNAASPLIADGPSGLVVLGSALFSLALLIFFKCKSSGRRRTAQT